MTLRCEDVRLALGPEPGQRPADGPLAEAFDHYAECAACQRFFRLQRALERRLGRLDATQSVSARLRERVRSAIADENVISIARRRVWWLSGIGAASLAAAAALVLLLSKPSLPQDIAQPLVVAARASLDDFETIRSADANRVGAWLQSRVGFRVEIPQITDALLLGARIADIGGSRSAEVVYLLHGKPVSYFAMPSNELMGNPVRGNEVIPVSGDGYEVVVWSEEGSARAVVAPMPRRQVMEIAEECRAMSEG